MRWDSRYVRLCHYMLGRAAGQSRDGRALDIAFTGHLDWTKAHKVALPNLKPTTKTISQAAFRTSTSRSSLPAIASLATSRS